MYSPGAINLPLLLCMNILKALEHSLIFQADWSRVLPRIEHVVIVVVVFVVLKQLVAHIDATPASRPRREATLNRSIRLLDLFKPLCVPILRVKAVIGPAKVFVVELVGSLVGFRHQSSETVPASIAHGWAFPATFYPHKAVLGAMLICHSDYSSVRSISY